MTRAFVYLLIGFLGATSSLKAETVPLERRVLFIVETSKEMKASAESGRKLLGTLIGSGLGGEMTDGDSFGLWTFSDQVSIGRFPMQRWTASGAADLARRATNYLAAIPNEKAPHIEPVAPPLNSVLRHSPVLSVVLISSGKTPIVGTTYDTEINAYYKEHLRDFQKKKMPFVTIFLTRDAKVLRYAVSPAVGDVKIPKFLPDEIKPPETVQVTNAPVAPAPPPQPVEKRAEKALVITKSGAVQANVAEADQLASTLAKAAQPKVEAPKVEPAKTPEPAKADLPLPPLTAVVTDVQEDTYVATAKPAAQAEVTTTPAAKPESAEPVRTDEAVKSAPQPPVVQKVPDPAAAPQVANEKVQSKPTAPVAKLEASKVEPLPERHAEVSANVAANPIAANPAPVPQKAPPQPAPVQKAPAAETAPKIVASEETKPAPAPVAVAITPPKVESAESKAPETTDTKGAQVAATTPSSSMNYSPAAAVGLMIVAVLLAFVIGRATGRRTDRGSLITQSANRDKR